LAGLVNRASQPAKAAGRPMTTMRRLKLRPGYQDQKPTLDGDGAVGSTRDKNLFCCLRMATSLPLLAGEVAQMVFFLANFLPMQRNARNL